MYGAYAHPLSLTKHVLFVLYMYSRHPNIWECPHIFMGHPNIQGSIQTYGGIQTYRRVSKQGGIQTYRVLSKHMGASKHTGDASKYMGASKHIEGVQP